MRVCVCASVNYSKKRKSDSFNSFVFRVSVCFVDFVESVGSECGLMANVCYSVAFFSSLFHFMLNLRRKKIIEILLGSLLLLLLLRVVRRHSVHIQFAYINGM